MLGPVGFANQEFIGWRPFHPERKGQNREAFLDVLPFHCVFGVKYGRLQCDVSHPRVHETRETLLVPGALLILKLGND